MMYALKDLIVKGQKIKAGDKMPDIDAYELAALKRIGVVGSKQPKKVKEKQ